MLPVGWVFVGNAGKGAAGANGLEGATVANGGSAAVATDFDAGGTSSSDGADVAKCAAGNNGSTVCDAKVASGFEGAPVAEGTTGDDGIAAGTIDCGTGDVNGPKGATVANGAAGGEGGAASSDSVVGDSFDGKL